MTRLGYSDHHTGFAVDLSDEGNPSCDTELSFEQTSAFEWLKAHAGRYEFELSFPAGGTDEINYEPWHWRFTGTDEAKKSSITERSNLFRTRVSDFILP